MRLVLNWLLLCLLALALPLQGLAAVGARPCQPGVETLVQPVAAAAESGQAMHAMHAMHELAGQPHDAQAAAHSAHGSHEDSHAASDHSADPDHTCSSCASCCMGAALPVTVAVFAPSATPVALVPTQSAAAPGWLPPQPQRPPRPIAP